MVYHGPREQILPFFESQGMHCPPRKADSDFLQEVTSRKDQQVGDCPQYKESKTKKSPKKKKKPTRTRWSLQPCCIISCLVAVSGLLSLYTAHTWVYHTPCVLPVVVAVVL